jgi:hypothetical protein
MRRRNEWSGVIWKLRPGLGITTRSQRADLLPYNTLVHVVTSLHVMHTVCFEVHVTVCNRPHPKVPNVRVGEPPLQSAAKRAVVIYR